MQLQVSGELSSHWTATIDAKYHEWARRILPPEDVDEVVQVAITAVWQMIQNGTIKVLPGNRANGQETMTVLWKRSAGGVESVVELARPDLWALRVLRNVTKGYQKDKRRNDRRKVSLEPVGIDPVDIDERRFPSPEAALEEEDARRRYEQAKEQLKPADRELCDWLEQGVRRKEIAARRNISLDTVRKQISDLRKKLKKLMKPKSRMFSRLKRMLGTSGSNGS